MHRAGLRPGLSIGGQKRASVDVIEDVDGNLFLDFMAGIAVANTGHSHPHVVQAIEEQARNFCISAAVILLRADGRTLAEKLAD